ncbi:MAG TPA: hypothetical protein VIQ30_13550 [Pseudonocardia sp.]
MALGKQHRNRWIVAFGGDQIVIERTPAGLLAASIPARREVVGTRSEAVALINALHAAIPDTGDQPCGGGGESCP